MSPRLPATYSIGALAKVSGVAIDTIRYYEKEGLLVTARRAASGYRQFDAQALQRLQFVRQAKALGFSLDEIRDLLALSADREAGVHGVQQRAKQRLAELDRRIGELTAMRKALAGLVAVCPGRGEPEACPILMSLQAPSRDPSQVKL